MKDALNKLKIPSFFREYQQPGCPWNATQPAVLSAIKCEIGSIEPCRSVVISWPSRTDAADFSKSKIQFLMYCKCITFVTSQYVQVLVCFMLYNSGMSDCLHTRSSQDQNVLSCDRLLASHGKRTSTWGRGHGSGQGERPSSGLLAYQLPFKKLNMAWDWNGRGWISQMKTHNLSI